MHGSRLIRGRTSSDTRMSHPHPIQALHNWYLDGTVLHPTPDYLRQHVTALSNCHDAATLQFHFSDNRTITFAHAQISASPFKHLHAFNHMTVQTSSEAFDIIKQFIYCTPIDLSVIPCALVKASWRWRLYELYTACFLVAETARLDIIQLVEKYIPLVQTTHLPDRFKYYFAGRIAVDAARLLGWIRQRPAHEVHNSNRNKLHHALQVSGILLPTRNAMRLYSDLDETNILPEANLKKQTFSLVWRLPLADLLASGQEYVETEMSTPAVSASMEVTWNADGMGLVVGVQRVEASGAIDIRAAVIGLPCVCADRKHNAGWQLEGGVKGRNLDWVVSHEVGFVIFDKMGLREWRKVHRDCGLLVKVRVVVADSDTEADADGDLASESDADTGANIDVDGEVDVNQDTQTIGCI